MSNAGDFSVNNFDSTSVKDLQWNFDLNVKSHFILCKKAQPYLFKSKGSVVVVSSVAGLVPQPSSFGYSVAKAALDQFTRLLALGKV